MANKEGVLAKLPKGRPILCAKCGMGGGTLVKSADGKYIHKVCPRRIRVIGRK